MTVYVDEVYNFGRSVKGVARRYGTSWSHLSCGGDCEELHEMARRVGVARRHAQRMGDADHYWHHYDVRPKSRELAISLGAVFKPRMERAREHRQKVSALIFCDTFWFEKLCTRVQPYCIV